MTNPAPNSIPAASGHPNVVPSEVGWQFVPQYYTFVNKQPHRLHCFYTKISTFIHGTEGEDGRPCFGQQEIHNKILSIGFQDCKVFIHSVDAQASANNGIIIQVIGEMSNKGEAWRKFVQTFFLAEQPNGYFVLNDIFRFLKEESVESEDGEEVVAESEPTSTYTTPIELLVTETVVASTPSPAPAMVDLVPESQPAPNQVKLQSNGYHHDELEETSEPVDFPAPVATEPSAPVLVAEESHSEPAPSVQELPVEPVSTAPMQVTPAAVSPAPVHAQAIPPVMAPVPTPTVAPAPKSWAHLAATNSKKWGGTVAQESRGMSEIVSTPSPAPPTNAPSAPASGTQTPVTSGSRHNHSPAHGKGDQHPAFVAANAVTTPQVFVKGVTEVVTLTALTQALTSRFGPVKDVEIIRSKACAFLEFHKLEDAKRAITTSLPVSQGGDGGIRIDAGADTGLVRISVETKKERGDRIPSRGRGSAPSGGGENRGSYRGRGRGRGGPPPGK